MIAMVSVATLVTGQPEEDVFERRQFGAEIEDANPMLGQALDDLRHPDRFRGRGS
jgi:hypothetical protein